LQSRIFGGAYDDTLASERPKYGALKLPPKARRCSAQVRIGTCTAQRANLAAYYFLLSGQRVRTRRVRRRRANVRDRQRKGRRQGRSRRLHRGASARPVRLGHDVEALVLDPGFRGTDVEALSVALPCPVEWHHGFRLTTDDLRRHP
jgi:hypothetical protein